MPFKSLPVNLFFSPYVRTGRCNLTSNCLVAFSKMFNQTDKVTSKQQILLRVISNTTDLFTRHFDILSLSNPNCGPLASVCWVVYCNKENKNIWVGSEGGGGRCLYLWIPRNMHTRRCAVTERPKV